MKFIEKIIEKNERPISTPPVTLAFLGDSVTQGCFEFRKTENGLDTEFRVNDGYHYKLRKILEMCYPRVPINMIHAGISGDNVISGLKRAERDVLAYHPDLTVVSFGLNDCTLSAGKPLEDYKNALRELLKKIKSSGSEVIFMTQNLMADKVSPEITDADIRNILAEQAKHSGDFLKYMEAARKICAEEQITICDCARKWEILKKNGVDITRLLSNRFNHPTEEMHMMFAVSLFETIQGM